MIVLTGTSGGLGSGVLDTIISQNLLRPSDLAISAYSRDSASLATARKTGIQIRHGDMTKPDTLRESYRGADALFLVSYPSIGEERYELHKNAIDAAKQVGVKHILYTSLTFGGEHGVESHAGVMQAHLKTVEYLKSTGLQWTVIRAATYAHLWNNFAGFLNLESPPKSLEIVVANDGPNHWASRRDLAEGTAKIVARWRNFAGRTLNLTGSKTYSVRDILTFYCQASDQKLDFRIVGETAAVEYHKKQGSVPSFMEDFLPNWASWGEAMAKDEVAYIDPLLGQLLGRSPLTIEDMKGDLFKAETNILDVKDFV